MIDLCVRYGAVREASGLACGPVMDSWQSTNRGNINDPGRWFAVGFCFRSIPAAPELPSATPC